MYDNRGKHLHREESHTAPRPRPVWPSLSSPLTWAEKGDQVSSALPGSAQEEQNLWEAAGDLLSFSHWEHLYVVHSLHPRSVEEASEVTCLSCCPLGGATGPSKPRWTISETHFLFTSHYCTNFTSVLLTSHITTHVYMVVLLDLFSLLFILNAATKEQLLIFLNIWYLMSTKDSDSDFEQAGDAHWLFFLEFCFYYCPRHGFAWPAKLVQLL